MVRTEPEVIDVAVDGDQTQAELDLEEALKDAFSSLGEDKDKVAVVIKCYRAPQGENRRRWLFDLSEGEFNDVTKVLRDRYGSGIYEVRIMVGGRIYRRIMSEVEAPSDLNQLNARVSPEHSAPNTGDVLEMFKAMFAQQQDAQKQQTELILERMRAREPAEASADPSAMLASIVSAMASLNQLHGRAETTDPVSMLDKVMDLQIKMQTLSGGEGNQALSWAALARDFLPTLGKITQQKQAMQLGQRPPSSPVAPARRPPVAPARGPGPSAEFKPPEIELNQHTTPLSRSKPTEPKMKPKSNPPPQDEPMTPQSIKSQMIDSILGQALAYLTNKASQNASVEVYSEVVLDTVEEWGLMDELIELLERPDWLDRLSGHVGMTDPYRAWFGEMRQRILESVAGEVENEDLTARTDQSIDKLSTGYPQTYPQNDEHVDAVKPGETPRTRAPEYADGVTGGQSGDVANAKIDATDSAISEEAPPRSTQRG